jgi:nicotinamide-nucleotide amidase
VIGRATEDAELVVITGGVGPTEDDLTREAIAHFVGEEVHVDPSN